MNNNRYILCASLAACLAPAAWSANVLTNPGFESPNHITGWTGYGGSPTLTATTEAAHSGSQAALVTNRGATSVGIAQSILDKVKAGRGHDFRVWVRVRQNVSASFTLGIKRTDVAGTQYFALDSRTVAPGKWVKLGGYYRHNPTGTASLLQLYVAGPAAGVEFLVDDADLEPPVAYTPTGGAATDYVRALGHNLVVGAENTPLRLLGTNFVAYSDESDVSDSVFNSRNFDREDYAAVKSAGMNVVRLNVWYRLFEDNGKPYVYKQEGWDWLNKQIAWAREAGVYIDLSMMAPQCGYQGLGYTGSFWTGGRAAGSCQDRLKALWTEIARRYKDEPTLASFDLMNETLPANQAQYAAYIQQLIDAVRTQNTRHLVGVQTCFAADCEVPPLVNDANVLYDFHHYDSWLHSSQLAYGGNLGDSNMRYGDPSSRVLPWSSETTAGALWENPPIPSGTTGWTWYEGSQFTMDNASVIAIVPVFIATANTGKVTFDDFQVREYDPAGNLVRVVLNIDMEKAPANPYLLETFDPYLSFTGKTTTQRLSGTTGSRVIETTGHRGSASVSISGAAGKYLVKMPNLTFSGRQGYRYQIAGWIKGANATGGTGALGFQLQNGKSYVTPTAYDKDYLRRSLLTSGIQFSLDHNVPINIGEFGQNPNNYTAARGGLAWMADTLDLMAEYGASGQMWNWHSVNWGLYGNVYVYPDPDSLNQPLLNLFRAQDTGYVATPGGGSGGGNPPPAGTEVIVDNLDPGFAKVGTWTESSAGGEYLGSSYVNGTVGNAATWTAILTAAGNYQVYAWWAASSNRVTNAPYAIATAGGPVTITANQQANGGRWNLLGTYAFNVGAATVTLTHPGGSGLWSSADAVRFVPVPLPVPGPVAGPGDHRRIGNPVSGPGIQAGECASSLFRPWPWACGKA